MKEKCIKLSITLLLASVYMMTHSLLVGYQPEANIFRYLLIPLNLIVAILLSIQLGESTNQPKG